MSTIQIRGQASLKGEIEVQGSKNAVLPIMAAAMIHKGTTVLENVPRIQDVFCMMDIMEQLGCQVKLEGNTLHIRAEALKSIEIPEEYVKRMRSSIMVLGALLGREKEAVTYYPGGCSIGKRPIDLHLAVLRQLGAEITEQDGRIEAAVGRLVGTAYAFPFPSVGATENAILAGVSAEGTTVLEGCAKEPEIIELCRFLNQLGAGIYGIGTGKLTICGGRPFHDCRYRVGGDRIVAGTYLAAAMGAGGQVRVTNIRPSYLGETLSVLTRMGAEIASDEDSITLTARKRPDPLLFLKTGPYPEFPTDLQSPFMALLTSADGTSIIEETIFEDRFETAKELEKMGASIQIAGRKAWIAGGGRLLGARVKALDLRGGAALVIAGLMADGLTEIEDCFHILRGYEDICRDLQSVGADIWYKP